ncbi:uncharacterized protein MYCFIDRAFT_35070 [Pseudocercospora fijiensis CIRAD86]|uniref:Acyltransferase 3 domain-containing protein n=1 Tax=Pseudocercospora fijiensis (strain CIRAD86) TaxID=383855 RepID=M3AQR1_PSEFD|nr:uncharacterized protein MYCFIDRAFT_35070 [Pseudocercospora fijiensis CIRAD86]EME79433.1 hypothetical protein MYCFIDRAFT_35070 [Pseudocercospora fijiensis CIRAD86]
MAHTEVPSALRVSSDSHLSAHEYNETEGLTESLLDNAEKQARQNDAQTPLRQQLERKLAFILRPINRWCRRAGTVLPLLKSSTRPSTGSEDIITAAGKPKSTERAATAYLDGLRGVAALCVVFTHVEEWAQNDYNGNLDRLRKPWGWKEQHLLACWPMLRFIFTGGGFAVALFFIMSGYVLSNKPYKLIMARDRCAQQSLSNIISSAVFRRWFRLFIPIFAVNFLWVSIWYLLGIHNTARPETDHLPLKETWSAELIRLRNVMIELSSFFGPQDRERFRIYNPPTWTIPDEFRGSMVVYVTITSLAQFTSRSRLFCEVILCTYLWYLKLTPLVLFVIGMIMCHIDALLRTSNFPTLPSIRFPGKKWLWMLWYLPLLLGIYLGGGSEGDQDLATWRRYHAVGATLTMIAVPNLPWCKSLLESRFCLFLGRISYSLYLTHLPVLWVIGGRIYAAFGRFRGKPELYGAWANLVPLPAYGPVGMEINVVVPTIFFVVLAFGVAELATRFIDDPSVKFAQWLYRKGTTTLKEEPSLLPVQVDLNAYPGTSRVANSA